MRASATFCDWNSVTPVAGSTPRFTFDSMKSSYSVWNTLAVIDQGIPVRRSPSSKPSLDSGRRSGFGIARTLKSGISRPIFTSSGGGERKPCAYWKYMPNRGLTLYSTPSFGANDSSSTPTGCVEGLSAR
jgi:hypothetical protein